MRTYNASLLDIEYFLPDTIDSNCLLGKLHPQWNIDRTEEKTGVFRRHITKVGETAHDLALQATKNFFKRRPMLREKIDAIITCTQSPDYVIPSNSFLLQRDLNLNHNILAFDYNLACSGYVYGLFMAKSFINSGYVKNILLVTADTYSKYINQDDRSTRILFGDGATASWIGDPISNKVNPLISNFDDFIFSSEGENWDKFTIKIGASRNPTSNENIFQHNKISMSGIQVINFLNHRVIPQVKDLITRNKLEVDKIDQFFLHQASLLAIESFRYKLKISSDKSFSNIENIGNTVSSSLPILIKDFFSKRDIPKDGKIILCGFGAGLSAASILATK
jgi:3-oxoacyl-[acyl-carrier-protein] synthase-3